MENVEKLHFPIDLGRGNHRAFGLTMTDTTSPATPATARPDPAQDRARVMRQVRALEVLARVGSLIAALISAAWREPKAGDGGLAGLAFLALMRLQDRVGRAVRLATVLRLRLLERLAGGVEQAHAKAAPKAPTEPPTEPAEIDWNKVLDREMRSDLESFFRPEFSKAFLDRPADDLIASICHDLGLNPAWSGLAGGEADTPDIDHAAAVALDALVRRSQAKRVRTKPQTPPTAQAPPQALRPAPTAASP